MIDLDVPDLAIGALALAVVVLYAAWHEFRVENKRDTRLLAALGVASLLGGVAAWVQ